MPEFDFFSAFLGFDLGKAEAIAEIIGRVEAAFVKGMVNAGIDSEDARKIVKDAHQVMVRETLNVGRGG